jgi:hypothetical protein
MIIKSRRMNYVVHVTYMWEKGGAYKVLLWTEGQIIWNT